MDPKAVLQTVQNELQQLVQDLLGIDGEAQSRKETGLYGRRDQGSNPWFASKGRQDKDKSSRPSMRIDTILIESAVGKWEIS